MKRTRFLSLLLAALLLSALILPACAAVPPESVSESIIEIIFPFEDFTGVFSGAVNNWLTDLVNDGFRLFDSLLLDMLDTVFHAETLVTSGGFAILTATVLQNVYNFIYGVACSLVILKFLMKGFQIYILWRGGDADASPQDMLIGVGQAAVIMICFPWL